MVVEAFVLGRNQRAHQYGAYFLITNGCAIFIVVLANGYAVGAVDDAGFAGNGMLDVVKTRRAAKQPQKVHIYGT